MSLLTPPSSSHRSDKDKENKFPEPIAGPSTRSVVWAAQNSVHCLGTPPKSTIISSRTRPGATKSILKKSSQNIPTHVSPAPKKRETTPEPSDPLVNLTYLDHPIKQILYNGHSNATECLHELIEGYNVLAARLRSSVSDNTDADASWPLFQPLRKNTQAFVDAVVRDLGRALVDPLTLYVADEQEDLAGIPKFTLPSPQKSPMKKKSGMTAEQAKYARDLCVISHSVIKLLCVVLSISAISSVFDDRQLGQILTAILAIPLAEELPTPNARKTCALAIWLIQVQRLPASVLQPAADRIAYALRRGMTGELGKEGKKGSASDGLKAIHDLCVYLPAVFTPAFTPLLPTVLSNLLATTLTLRSQACHALGGFVIGATSIPHSPLHTQIANMVTTYITTVSSPNPKSPTKPTEAAIVRTLRTTMGATDPVFVAQGPVWAISVLASFIVLLRSKLCTDAKVNRIISSLLSLGMRHKKSSVRALCCVAWRTITWSYFQPPLLPQSEDDEEEEEASPASQDHVKKIHCKVMTSVVEMQAGISTVAALLGQESTEDESLRLSLEILDTMTTKGGHTCIDAMDALQHMTSISKSEREDVEAWDFKLLIPKSLFSANPGLLTADYKNLCATVRPIFDELAQTQDIRLLTKEDISKEWVFDGILHAWRNALYHLEMFDEGAVPENIIEIWSNLIKARVSLLEENGDEDGISEFAANAVRYLVVIVQDSNLDLRPNKSTSESSTENNEATSPDSDDTVPDCGLSTWTSAELRLKVVERLWAVMLSEIPRKLLSNAGDVLMDAIVASQMTLVPESARMTTSFEEEEGERARNAWLGLCLDVLQICDANTFKAFWSVETEKQCSPWPWNGDFTREIWKKTVQKWMEMEGCWEAGIVLLGLPFSERHAWNLLGDDYNAWGDLLMYATAQDPDQGSDAPTVLDKVAEFVSIFQNPGKHTLSSLRLVDMLISHLDAPELREVPANIFKLTSVTMFATYPLHVDDVPTAKWLIRSMMTFIEKCPPALCLEVLQLLDEGLCLWLADKDAVWTEDDMSYDIIPLYQYILLRIRALQENAKTLGALENILDSVFVYREPKQLMESFLEYWKNSYGRLPPPVDGWSHTIQHCLQVVGLLPRPMEIDTPLSPVLVSVYPSSPFSTPPTAITGSPQRPHKVFADFPIVPSTPVSPLRRRSSNSSSNSSITRTPLSSIQLGASPSKRRRLMSASSEEESKEEKENFLGPNMITSVMDRIAGLTPTKKKRRYEDDEEDDVPPARLASSMTKLKGKMKPKSKPASKKARIPSPAPSAASSNESEDERWVERTLTSGIPFPTLDTPAGSDEEMAVDDVPVPIRKRRGDDAAVTRAPIVYGSSPCQMPQEPERTKSSSLDGYGYSNPASASRKIDLSKVPLRRSTSHPDSLLASIVNRKRKRADSDSPSSDIDQDLYDLKNTTPIPALSIEARPRHFKKAFTVPSSDSDASTVAGPSMSSDDDPHIGQVTPHHLISPAMLRRPDLQAKLSQSSMSILKELFGDSPLGSDDSMSSDMPEAESPTKDLVTRQLQRTNSRTYPSIENLLN